MLIKNSASYTFLTLLLYLDQFSRLFSGVKIQLLLSFVCLSVCLSVTSVNNPQEHFINMFSAAWNCQSEKTKRYCRGYLNRKSQFIVLSATGTRFCRTDFTIFRLGAAFPRVGIRINWLTIFPQQDRVTIWQKLFTLRLSTSYWKLLCDSSKYLLEINNF